MKERHSFIYSWPAAEWQWGCSAVLGVVIHGVWCLLCYKWSSVSMECEHNIDKATLQHRYCNYLTSWIVYIKSYSQHILTVPLYEEYHHHHHQSHPPHPVPKLSVCSVHHHSDCLPLNSRVPNSALWVPRTQKWVPMTRYVEARKVDTDCVN